MKTAIIGGTFDPVHNGHLHLLHWLVATTDYQRILFIPVFLPPHKTYRKRVSDQDRIGMLKLALQAYPGKYPEDRAVELVVDDCEIRRQGVSYMFDTVRDVLIRYHVEGRPAVVIGDDLLPGLTSWHRFEELRGLVDFLVFNRSPDVSIRVMPSMVSGRVMENPLLGDSSTEIREILHSGATDVDLASLMPLSVVDYIRKHGLYTD
jgi:nicotinate-nucleotide adenylyltransferase